ncbi:hypothetical protein ZHAS_00017410 [Anopheles sinensis]|uniref:Uncharacterized protein n=1 Tax=Anopheles sinensis TaxID=74873 RepID=A0A084WGF1_ANOSI|nr:hypothetical protein ZHAS_00017410 [Anopheles sinensis]
MEAVSVFLRVDTFPKPNRSHARPQERSIESNQSTPLRRYAPSKDAISVIAEIRRVCRPQRSADRPSFRSACPNRLEQAPTLW